jgi:hypothetical protein
MNCLYQFRLAKWFCEKIDGSALHRPHRGRNIASPGNEYDGWMISIGNLLLKLQATDVREFHVQNQAGGKIGPWKIVVFGGRPKRQSAQPQRRQELTKRFAHVLVVIYDEDDPFFHDH